MSTGGTSSGNKSTEFFAALEDPIQLANAMKEKIREYREYCTSTGLMDGWARKLKNYYGVSESGNTSQQVTVGGSEGELSLIKVNDLHSLLQEQLVIVTSQRPAGIARAINTDTQSLKSSKIGTAIAEYYMSQAGFEPKFVQAAETALLCDEAFMDLYWDKNAGDPIAVDPETGQPEMSGDAVLRMHAPWNAARDMGMIVENQKWHIISYKENKFDSAAAFPKFAERIIACGDNDDLPAVPMDKTPEGSDAIWHHLLVADRTPARPTGRYAILIGDDIVLDTDLPYKPYPVDRIAPSDVIDGPNGYAAANDIMGLEQITDGLHSIITSNEITFGGQNLVAPEGNNLKVSDIGKGLRVFELPPDLVDKLKALELCHTPAEVFNYIGMLSQKKERAVGSVQTSLAQQAAQGASGNSMALIQTQSISFNSGIQRSYFKLLSSVMTKLIEILRTYADTPRVARIVGKSKAAGLKEFKYTGEDLNSISSIVYEIVNPLMQTFGGRMEMCDKLIKAGEVKSPKQLINFVTTGQPEVLFEDDEADGMLILEENEALTEGRPVKALITEIHIDHIKSHNSLITQQAKEQDPDLVARVLAHNQEHINLWMKASMQNPAILLATGQQPLMAPQMPGSLPAPGAGPSLGKEMVGGGQSPAVTKAMEVREPELPNVAGTKEKPPIPGVTELSA